MGTSETLPKESKDKSHKEIIRQTTEKRLNYLVIILIVIFSIIFVFVTKKDSSIDDYINSSLIALQFQEEPYTYPWSDSTEDQFLQKVVETAKGRTDNFVKYDDSYISIDYPGGDVPDDTGVCTDVIIRAYRGAGVDLQKEIHEDMSANFSDYPNLWNLTQPDSNIDHRRVQNLEVLFTKYGKVLPITKNPEDYQPGDIVTWNFTSSLVHIGIVVDEKSADGERFLIVHNGGGGTVMQDVLFSWEIRGHYRYLGRESGTNPI
ncbi:DUF1287 domain-containing protein [Candidatus Dojkabacteria bacterium]|nr:DUF1287 domain-containing protein [Candidatus Dojkabacteria bacterium]